MILNHFKSRFVFAFLLVFYLIGVKGQRDSSFVVDSVKNIIPVFTTTVDLLDNESQSQDISGLLQS